MTECIIGFDTSNYTTSIAVATLDGKIVANLKRPLPVKEGARGLRQSDAVFEHTRNLPHLTRELSEILMREGLKPVGVAVSGTPRDAEGSYMPCFLAGVAAASSFAASSGLPVFEFSHQNGHIAAAVYSSGMEEYLEKNPFLAFHVSGGTTELLFARYGENGLEVTLVGETDDINGGQLIDRVGVMMGLDFPAGKEMEKLATAYKGKIYSHPVCVREGRCSLSGAENIAKKLYEKDGDPSEVAAFVFDFIRKTLTEMGKHGEMTYGKVPVLFAGGVMSNKLMRDKLNLQFEAYYAEPQFSADNAAGIALLGVRRYLFAKQR